MFGHRRISSAALTSTGAACLLLASLALPAGAAAANTVPVANAAKPSAASPDCKPATAFHRGDFPDHPKIDNRYLPLTPGMNTVVSGTVVGDDGKLHPHQIIATATNVTKVIYGVRTMVLYERDIQDGKLQEPELAFQAQDEAGTVWNIGEYPEEYVNGKLDGAPSTWIAGIDHAKPGVNVLAHPKVGIPAYLQGLASSVGFHDCAKVVRTGQHLCLKIGCYHGVLVTDEWSPLDPSSGHQRKYYAPGVGSIRVGAVGGANQEVLSLTSVTKLSRAALAKVNAAVLRQDRRGYRVSPDVYGHTPRAVLEHRVD